MPSLTLNTGPLSTEMERRPAINYLVVLLRKVDRKRSRFVGTSSDFDLYLQEVQLVDKK